MKGNVCSTVSFYTRSPHTVYSITITYLKLKTKTETTEWMNYKLKLSARYSNYEILIDMRTWVNYRLFFDSHKEPQQKNQRAAGCLPLR